MRDAVFALVESAIADLNDELQYDSLRDVSDATPVFGGPEGIDSLSLVSLVIDLESRVRDELGAQILLSDEKAMSARHSPYRTAGALADFIVARLGGNHA